MIRRSSSAESAARFIAMRRGLVPQRSFAAQYGPRSVPVRYELNIAAATHAELIDCVTERLQRFKRDGKDAPHITTIALRMLHEAREVQGS